MSEEFVTTLVDYQRFFIDERYQNLKPIGLGSYGFVVSAIDCKTGNKVAIKKIRQVFQDTIDAKRILRELKLLRHLNGHENITTILDIMTVPRNTRFFEDLYIVTNLLDTDLEHVIESRQPLSDEHIQYFMYQILRGLKYMHSANIIHRDLKPANILANTNCDVAICDLGLARGIDGLKENFELTEYVVTRWYRAPEILCACLNYGKPVDIWSAACIFAELINRQALFRGQNNHDQLKLIVHKMGCPPEEKLDFIPNALARQTILDYADLHTRPFHTFFVPDANPLAIDLIKKMLAFHPADRLTAEEALNHKYFSLYQGQVLEPTAEVPFDYTFEKDASGQSNMTEEQIRLCMYEEAGMFRPHVMDLDDELTKKEFFPSMMATMQKEKSGRAVNGAGGNVEFYINPNRQSHK